MQANEEEGRVGTRDEHVDPYVVQHLEDIGGWGGGGGGEGDDMRRSGEYQWGA
jgi:hypothetical protein